MPKVYRSRTRYFRRRKRTNTWQYILLFLVIFFVLYLIGAYLLSRNQPYENYYRKVKSLVARSNKQAANFKNLWEKTGEIKRTQLEKKLDQLAKEASQLEKQVNKLSPPKSLEKAHLYLQMTFELRRKGLKNYKPALLNALAHQDIEVASHQVSNALMNLTLSDRAYANFRSEANKLFRARKLKPTFPSSIFLPSVFYEKTDLLEYLKNLKGITSLKEVHGLAIISIATKPQKKSYDASKGLNILPHTDFLMVTIEVENQGNVDEKNVPIRATLTSETNPEVNEYKLELPLIKKGERKAVTFENILITNDRGVVYLLTVEAGPVPGEQYAGNNKLEFKFSLD